jgi:hypothetical protein
MIAWTSPSATREQLETDYVPLTGGRIPADHQDLWVSNYRVVELIEEILPDFGITVERSHYHVGRGNGLLVMGEWVVDIPGAEVIPGIEYTICIIHSNARSTGYESRLFLGARIKSLAVGFVAVRVDLLHRRKPINLEWKINLTVGLQKLLQKIGAVPLFVERLREVPLSDGQASQIILGLAQGAICAYHSRLAIGTYFRSEYPETTGATLWELYISCALAISKVPPEAQFYRLCSLRQRLLPFFDGEVVRL